MNRKLLFTAIAALGLTLPASAIIASPGVLKGYQPDGTPMELRLFGDEYFSWAQSPDGYTLLRDADGFWTVAEASSDGLLRPTAIRYRGAEARSIAGAIRPGLVISAQQAAAMRRKKTNPLQVDNSFPTTGKHKLLMLLVNFADTNPSFTQGDFDNLMNQENYKGIGSFRDFYKENSYGALDIETTVTPWIRLSGRRGDYTIDNTPALIREALQAAVADNSINLADYDNDGDGVLDGLAVIHQGGGQEATGSSLDIWSHSSVVTGMSINGIQVGRYTIEPETYGNTGQISTVGVVCHEFGHNLGAPDFYDTDYSGSGGEFPGTGVWDLMGSGAWNSLSGDSNRGNRPAGINMWQKIQYGWVTPEVLSETKRIEAMPNSTKNATAYRLDSGEPGDYFIIENRQRTGNFDSALPGAGLLVYHAQDNGITLNIESNTVNSRYPQYMYTVCAAANIDPTEDPASYGVNAWAPYPYQGKNELCDTSPPSTRSFGGRNAYRGIHNITANDDGTIAFDFTLDDAPEAPVNLTSRVDRGVVTLGWDFTGLDDIEHFTVYRNGSVIAETGETSFRDDTPELSGSLTYQVDALHKSGLVSPYASVSLRIPVNISKELTATAEENEITLSWDVEPTLSRVDNTQSNYREVKHDGAPRMEYACRYRVHELAPYKGYKVRYINFVPYLAKSEADYIIRVYEADPGGTNPVCVSERKCKELGTRIWNRVLLTKTVEITGEKEIWIAVEMTSNLGTVVTLTDFEKPIAGLGNWANIDGAGWGEDPLAEGNFFVFATLAAADETEVRPLVEPTDPFNADTDLFAPMGFSIYRDGELIGTSSSRMFKDTKFKTGEHTYSVASLYPMNNESSVCEVTVYGTQTDGVAEMASESAVSVRALAGGVRVDGYAGVISIYNTAGMSVYRGLNTGNVITLAPGVYILRAGDSVSKIIVR